MGGEDDPDAGSAERARAGTGRVGYHSGEGFGWSTHAKEGTGFSFPLQPLLKINFALIDATFSQFGALGGIDYPDTVSEALPNFF